MPPGESRPRLSDAVRWVPPFAVRDATGPHLPTLPHTRHLPSSFPASYLRYLCARKHPHLHTPSRTVLLLAVWLEGITFCQVLTSQQGLQLHEPSPVSARAFVLLACSAACLPFSRASMSENSLTPGSLCFTAWLGCVGLK